MNACVKSSPLTALLCGCGRLERRHGRLALEDHWPVRFYFDGASIGGDGCSFIQILNNTIDRAGTGISELDDCDDVLVSGNVFEGITNDAIRQWGYRWTIRNNMVVAERDVGDDHFDFWQTWCASSSSSIVPADYALVENNLFAEIEGRNVHFFLFHQTTSCGSDMGRGYIIRHNRIRRIGSNGVTFDNDSGAPGFEGVAIYNNVFGELSDGEHPDWRDYVGAIDAASGTAFFINNILYDAVSPTSADGIHPASVPADCTLAYDPDATITTGGALEASTGSIVNEDPLFNDYAGDDFSLDPASPAIDAGCPLTSVDSSDSGSGAALIVEAPWFFAPGWGGAEPDCIAVGTVTNTACIVAIDYGTRTLTLESSLVRSAGDSVWLYSDSDGTVVLLGDAPDIGAVEFSGLCADVACTALDECHDVGTCDPESGECSQPTLPDGTRCSVGTCVDGACTEGPHPDADADADADVDADAEADGAPGPDGDTPDEGNCRVVEGVDEDGNPTTRIVCGSEEPPGCSCSAASTQRWPRAFGLIAGISAVLVLRRIGRDRRP